MKWLIASDIHGSGYYCQKLLEAFEKEKADKLVLLGDILYHGPRNDLPKEYNPKAVIQMLNNIKENILCVRGNCDSEVDQMVLAFPIMAEYAVICEKEKMIYLTHGHIYSEQNPLPMNKGDILLTGHTHIAKCKEYEEFTYINPGSVSIPKENTHHGYIVLENAVFTWKDFDGNEIMKHHI